jgi:hypothetical protein
MPIVQEALELELEFVSALLRRSRAQHGTSFYHRKMSQLVSVVRSGQFVCVTKVIETMQFLASKLESDTYRTYNNTNGPQSGVERSSSTRSSNTTSFRTECIGEKWYYDLPVTVSSSVVAAASQVLPNRTLCSHIRWLGTLHKQGKFQEVTSRMYSTMHTIFLETSRGFFLPLLSVAAASLARIHSIVMILARQSLLALLQVRETLQSLFQHISAATTHLSIVMPQPMARYVTVEGDSAAVVTWSHLQNFVTTTCGWLSHDVDLPQYMEVTPMQYDTFLTTYGKTLDAHLYTRRKDPCQSSTEKATQLLHNQEASKRQERKNFKKKDDKGENVRLNGHSNLNIDRDDDGNDEDIGDHIEYQSEQKSDEKIQVSKFYPSASSTKQASSNIHHHTLKAVDIRHHEDSNSVILSSLHPNNRNKEKDESKRMKKNKYGECDSNKAVRRRKRKVSGSGMSVIDEIFSFSQSTSGTNTSLPPKKNL